MRTEQPTKCFVPLLKLRARLAPKDMFNPPSDSLLTVLRRWFCCGSLLPIFSVRVSVTFHLMCVHIIFSSVSVAELAPFGKIAAHSVDHMFSLHFDYLYY